MKIRNDELRQLNSIAEGGEGVIYEYNGNILKVYKKTVNLLEKEKKITSSAWKALPKEVVAPKEAVYNSSGKFIGFIMQKVSGEELRVLTNKKFSESERNRNGHHSENPREDTKDGQ